MGAKKSSKRKVIRKPAVVSIVFGGVPINLAAGEKYIGTLIGANGKGHHVVLLPGDQAGTWDEMMGWAKKQGGDLPNRIEQAMLFADHRDEFKRDLYWSNTPYADDAGYAWCQNFYYGHQSSWHKSNKGRARAVRRLPI